uniref:Uncharacterized protein n=1 Tax=Arundo donax TaxID=35708 RepID=A0A0A9FFU0_ARUDO
MKLPAVFHMEQFQEWTCCDYQLQLFHMHQFLGILDG